MALCTGQGSGYYALHNEPVMIGSTVFLGHNLMTGAPLTVSGLGVSSFFNACTSYVKTFFGIGSTEEAETEKTTTNVTTSRTCATTKPCATTSTYVTPQNVHNYLRPFDPSRGIPS